MIAPLPDAEARRHALIEREKSLLVEAGAGSGKTALMAGRVVLLLADGVPPARIAAITFTELAAAELAERIRAMAESLLDRETPVELEVALPHGLSDERRENLRKGVRRLDDLTATTIHGFALDLIRPYPAEADMDPGARPMDAGEAALLFDDVFETWLRERLGGPADGDDVAVQMALHAPDKVTKELREIARLVADHPELATTAPDRAELQEALARTLAALEAVVATLETFAVRPEGHDKLDALRTALEDLRHRSHRPVEVAFRTLTHRPHPPFNKTGGMPKRGIAKAAWEAAASACGSSKADGGRAYTECRDHYDAFCKAFATLEARAVETIVAESVHLVREVHARYATRKREGALLDFDDMLISAVRLLREHPEVRDALSDRYRHVLVDEFQDTDPRQAEIVWRLTGEPQEGEDWRSWPSRGARRFVVGDPKQSIYRFRGADVNTYLLLRDAMRADPNGEELSISTNFRSVPGILDATNRTFGAPLDAESQPGYTPLHAHREASPLPAVARLELPTPEGTDPGDAPNVDLARDVEAQAVARLCARLIAGDPELYDGRVPPGHIALLAPAGTQLWRYERELERMGIAVASQAGKGFYTQQEVQDLLALTRTLADPYDLLAFGALLRGPLVGVTEERLLDALEELRAAADGPEEAAKVRLTVRTDPDALSDEGIRRVLRRLRPLSFAARGRTPYGTLSAALEQLEVRAIIHQRHGGRAERALANVEQFLESTRPWAVRGLRAFARDVNDRWKDGERAIEGRPDSAEDAVTLITVHSAKGLEWPVVVPINTLGEPPSVRTPFVGRRDGRIWNRVGGFCADGWDEALEREKAECLAEDVRLLYVAATRARDLLVVPKPAWTIKDGCWLALTGLADLEGPEIPFQEVRPTRTAQVPDAAQDPETFRREAHRIFEATPKIHWSAPSRHERTENEGAAVQVPNPQDVAFDEDVVGGGFGGPAVVAAPEASGDGGADGSDAAYTPDTHDAPDAEAQAPVAGRGWVRGLVLHALMEGLVTGEIVEIELEAAAAELTDRLLSTREHAAGEVDTGRPDAEEMARAARRAWEAPGLADVRNDLIAEMNVYGHTHTGGVENLTSGIADAVAVDAEGRPYEVIDWKSDVHPSEKVIAEYRQQVRDYMRLTGAERGRVVFLTSGDVETVTI